MCWHNRGWLCIFQQHQFMGWVLSVPRSAVTYNYSPLRGDSAMDSNLEGRSWNHWCAAVILLTESGREDVTSAKTQNPETQTKLHTSVVDRCKSSLLFYVMSLCCCFLKDINTHACICYRSGVGSTSYGPRDNNCRPASPHPSASQDSSCSIGCFVHWPMHDHHWSIWPSDAEDRSKQPIMELIVLNLCSLIWRRRWRYEKGNTCSFIFRMWPFKWCFWWACFMSHLTKWCRENRWQTIPKYIS